MEASPVCAVDHILVSSAVTGISRVPGGAKCDCCINTPRDIVVFANPDGSTFETGCWCAAHHLNRTAELLGMPSPGFVGPISHRDIEHFIALLREHARNTDSDAARAYLAAYEAVADRTSRHHHDTCDSAVRRSNRRRRHRGE